MSRITRKHRLKRIVTGYARFGQFPSRMGEKNNPNSVAYFDYQGLAVAVIGPRHDQQTGRKVRVRSVAGRAAEVILGERIEKHPTVPIAVYKFKVVRRERRLPCEVKGHAELDERTPGDGL